ncbi:Hypp2641 [Branchiostoma lanceolatum]|uniref:Hypp2641 protein n=1 Tax=Branchiostoma lanceolatum TaxID=7740 RepID=A0A8K0ERC8_BRALA|nr:Hypp2641 [Branchiostoma lanceolatum]
MAAWGSKKEKVDDQIDDFNLPGQSGGFEDDFDPNFHHSQIEPPGGITESKEENSSSSQWPSEEESNKYVASLEARLKHMKGNKGSKLTSKEMLKTLEDSKMDHMRHLVTGDEALRGPYISEMLPDEDVTSPGCFAVPGTSVKRRIFPEQPLTVNEKEGLLELDTEEPPQGEKTLHVESDKGGER